MYEDNECESDPSDHGNDLFRAVRYLHDRELPLIRVDHDPVVAEATNQLTFEPNHSVSAGQFWRAPPKWFQVE